MPVDPVRILTVLERLWLTPLGKPNLWRIRALAVLSVALAAPAGTTCKRLCGMLPHELIGLRMPKAGWKWVRWWLRLRSGFLGVEANYTPWVALPPMSRGMPDMIGWTVQQTLHRAGAPAWRIGALRHVSWPDRLAHAWAGDRRASYTSPMVNSSPLLSTMPIVL